MAKIMIWVEGGVVQSVRGDAEVDVLLVDMDNLKCEEYDGEVLDKTLETLEDEYPIQLRIGQLNQQDYRRAGDENSDRD
jgi:hypothetical protein